MTNSTTAATSIGPRDTHRDTHRGNTAHAIADLIVPSDLTPDYLIPESLDYRVAPRVAAAVAASAAAAGLAQQPRDPREVEANCRDRVYEGAAAL